MKTAHFLTGLLIATGSILPGASRAQDEKVPADTAVQDKAIEQVLQSPTPPKQQEANYVNELTRYGFRDLFKNYSYNPAMPYSSQVNPNAEPYMQDYLRAHGRYLQQMKATSVPYFNLIDRILESYGLPRELKYLAVIESDLKPDALSSKGALGPWQLMSGTATDYGLEVDSFEDDRTDYTKSTHAAAKYLLSLYKEYHDWLLVIAAYNGGPGRVDNAIKKSGSRNFWDLQYYLPEESRDHVKKFIATHYIMETPSTRNNFNFTSIDGTTVIPKPDLTPPEADSADSVHISGRYLSSVLSRDLAMAPADFDRYNPSFDNVLSTGAMYTMRLPRDKMKLFAGKKYPILQDCIDELLGEASGPAPAGGDR